MPYYAVKHGRVQGIYTSWDDCKAQVDGYSGAKFKRFNNYQEAYNFLNSSINNNNSADLSQETSKLHPDTYNYKNSSSRLPFSESNESQSQKASVYIDGSSLGNGSQSSRAGYGVYWGPNDPRNLCECLEGDKQTNQRAEIKAAIEAVKSAGNSNLPLDIYSDSHYVIKGMTCWKDNWMKKGWKTSTGGPVENGDLFRELDDLVRNRQGPVSFVLFVNSPHMDALPIPLSPHVDLCPCSLQN